MSVEFAKAYEDHVWHVYGYFAYRLRSRSDAEDLTQVTFERALRAWGRFDERRASAHTWLIAIAHNVLVDHYRQTTSRTRPIDGADDLAMDAEAAMPGPEQDVGLSPELAEALAALGERDRQIIALKFGADLSGPEIAQLLDLSLANVQQILSRSLRKLRGVLEATEAASARRAPS